MIAADKNHLQASLTQGVLQIQSSLIDLYTSNLNSIGTLGALVAGFAYTGIAEAVYPDTSAEGGIIFFYYFFDIACLTFGVFCISQATIVTMYGPSLALNGETADAVTTAVSHMCDQQTFTFKIGAVSVTSLLLAACLLTWDRREAGVAAMCTVVYIAVYAFMVREGLKAYELFKIEDEDVGQMKASSATAMKYKQLGVEMAPKELPRAASRSGDESRAGSVKSGEGPSVRGQLTAADSKLVEQANTKARGVLFWRGSLSSGGQLRECYAVLEKGMLDFYRHEEDFQQHVDPINPRPFKLGEFRLELDYKKFLRNEGGLKSSMRGAVLGQPDFSAGQLMMSPFALKEASRKFKFALLPKVGVLCGLQSYSVFLLLCGVRFYQNWQPWKLLS